MVLVKVLLEGGRTQKIPLVSIQVDTTLSAQSVELGKKYGLRSLDGYSVWEMGRGADGEPTRELPLEETPGSLSLRNGTLIMIRKKEIPEEKKKTEKQSQFRSAPPGYRQYVDDKTKRMYFVESNKSVDEKEYVWTLMTDDSTGKVYYLNMGSREVCWELPRLTTISEPGVSTSVEDIPVDDSSRNTFAAGQSVGPFPDFSGFDFVSVGPPPSVVSSADRLSFISSASLDENQESPGGDQRKDDFDLEEEEGKPELKSHSFTARQMLHPRQSSIRMTKTGRGRGTFAATFARRTTAGRGTFSSRTSSPFQRSITAKSGVALQRGEYEDSVEEQMFVGPRRGTVRVLWCAKMFLYIVDDEERRRKKKKRGLPPAIPEKLRKEEKMLVIARDWAGAYGFFILDASGKFSKKYSFFQGVPLVEGFALNDQKETRDVVKFILNVDDVHFSLESSPRVRAQLESAMRLTYSAMYGVDKAKEEQMLMRLASVDFVTSTMDLPEPSLRRVEKTTKISLAKGRHDAACLVELRKVIYSPPSRDLAISIILDYIEHRGNSWAIIQSALDCLEQTMKSPCVSTPDTYERTIAILEQVRSAKKVYGDEVSTQAEELMEDFSVLDEILAAWQGRAYLPEVPFPKQFHYGASKKDRRDKKKERFFRNRWNSGFYVCSVFQTKDDELLMDGKENLPAVQVSGFPSRRNMDRDDPDFQWILKLGPRWWENLRRNYFRKNAFQSAVAIAFEQLKVAVGTADLGVLLDRPVYIESSDTSLFVCGNYYEHGAPFVPREPHMWQPLVESEHVFYERYVGLDENALLESMSSSLFGTRFVKAAVDHYASMTEKLPEGVYLCYFDCVSDLSGFNVLVRDDCRVMLPSVFVSSTILSPEEWYDIQECGRKLYAGEEIIPEEQTIDFGFPERDSTLIQRFHRALFELAAELGHENMSDLGVLYDKEPLFVDELNHVQIIVIGRMSNSLAYNKEWEDRFVWIELDQFETANFSLYVPELFPRYHRSCFDARASLVAAGPIGDTFDEVCRSTEVSAADHPVKKLQDIERKWLPMRWAMRLLEWCTSGCRSIVDDVPDKESLTLPTLLEKGRNLHPLAHLRARSLIIQDVLEGRPATWAGVEKKLEVLEKQDIGGDTQKGKNGGLASTTDISGVEQRALEFTIDEFANVDAPYVPSTRDYCEMIVYDLVAYAYVEAVHGKDVLEIESVIDSMVVSLEEDEVQKELEMEEGTLKNVRERLKVSRKRRQRELVDSFQGLKVEKSEKCESPLAPEELLFGKHIRRCITEFDDLVGRVGSMQKLIVRLQDMSDLAGMVSDLNERSARHKKLLKNPVTRGSDKGDSSQSHRSSFSGVTPATLKRIAKRKTPRKEEVVVEEEPKNIVVNISDVIERNKERTRNLKRFFENGKLRKANSLGETFSRAQERKSFYRSRRGQELQMKKSSGGLDNISESGTHPASSASKLSASIDAIRTRSQLYRAAPLDVEPVNTPEYSPVSGRKVVQRSNSEEEEVSSQSKPDLLPFVPSMPSLLLVSSDNDIYSVDMECAVKNSVMLGSLSKSKLLAHTKGLRINADSDTVALACAYLGDPYSVMRNPPLWIANDQLEITLDVCNQLGLPLLFIYGCSLLPGGVFDMMQVISASFVMKSPLRKWAQWEEELMGTGGIVVDVMWHLRFWKEFKSTVAYEEMEGKWREGYSRARIERSLRSGMRPDEIEMELWKNVLGRSVTMCSLHDTNVEDQDVVLLGMCCPNLQKLDLSRAVSVTGESVLLLRKLCPSLELLDIRETSSASKDVINALKEVLPELNVVAE